MKNRKFLIIAGEKVIYEKTEEETNTIDDVPPSETLPSEEYPTVVDRHFALLNNNSFQIHNSPIITFYITNESGQQEVLRVEQNGDFFVNQRLVTNDLEIVEGLRSWLISSGFITRPTNNLPGVAP